MYSTLRLLRMVHVPTNKFEAYRWDLIALRTLPICSVMALRRNGWKIMSKIFGPAYFSGRQTIFRYIDDFLVFSAETTPLPPPKELYQMNYSDTSIGSSDVVYLGMRIRYEKSKESTPYIRMSIWDKENLFNFQPIKYPHVDSCAPRSLGLKAVCSELLPLRTTTLTCGMK